MTAIDDLRSLLPVPPSVSRPAIDWVAVEHGTATEFLNALLTESLPAGRLFDEFADMVDEFGAYCDFYHEGRKIDRVTAA
ncbi:hypothetical protein AB0I30_30705 [Nocardia tengchongensis]|uniref:hypothetical protein n=1 Tax=Nocardia tengchongensis TaxID=2055889 RepID=UPI0033DC0EAD